MDYDSPDWDRTPTESIEVKDEAPHLTKAEPVEPSTNDTKLEPSGQHCTGKNLHNIHITSCKSPPCFPHILPEPFHTQHATDKPQTNTNTAHSYTSASHSTTCTTIYHILYQH